MKHINKNKKLAGYNS